MKVKYVGEGGYLDTPVYEDENGKLYFDTNNGYGELSLYTGAYRDKYGDIMGEPYNAVKEPIECDNPYRLIKDGRNLKADRNLKQFMQLALLMSCYKKFGYLK